MIEFRPVQCSADAYARYQELFLRCFPKTDKFQPEYLDWLYRQNPDGSVVGFDAWEGDQLAAHYVCVPARAEVGGLEVSVLLSLNTATDPAFQGKGLFTKLADLTYRAGAEQGFDSVYGVANANSTPGFLRKLQFSLVEPLQARVGIGALNIDFAKLAGKVQFRRAWSNGSLAWRCSSPVNKVVARPNASGATFQARAIGGGIVNVCAELDRPVPAGANGATLSPLRLSIGLIPSGVASGGVYFDIPKRLRPSPLNLIYRSLSGRVPTIASGSVFFTFLDFDAY